MKLRVCNQRAVRPKLSVCEEGQNLVEMAIVTPFMLILLLAIVEMGQVFYAYIAMVNAARDGSIYASLNPGLSAACPDPLPQVGTSNYGAMTAECKTFADRVGADTVAALLDSRMLTIARPISTTVYPPAALPYQNITVTVSYQLSTFSSGMEMPFFGRLGLPATYNLSHSMGMPIRNVP